MEKFCLRLKELRDERKLSTSQLGKEIGVSAATISRWENGLREPMLHNLIALAKFFGVTIDFLAGLNNNF